MDKPKKGSLKNKSTYIKKTEVASSTAVKDKMKDIRQDPTSKIQFTNIKGNVVKSVKNNTGKVVKRTYTKGDDKITQTSKGSKLIKKTNRPALVSGEYKETVDTTGYSKGKKNFPYEFSYPEVKNASKTGKTKSTKSTMTKENVNKNFVLKKGGSVKSKKKK